MLIENVLLGLVFCAFSCSGVIGDPSQYIYATATEKNFVQEISGDSDVRPSFIYSSNYPNGRVVTFYAHWCPHCLHFKPQYIELSNQIHDMSQKLHVAVETFAISCVPNRKICQEKGIHGYPTVMFYPPNSINGTKIQYRYLNPKDIFEKIKSSGVTEAGDESTGSDKAEKIVSTVQQSSRKSYEESDNIPQKPYFIHRSRAETFHDAHLSFHFAMSTAIFTQPGPLPEKPKQALKEFLAAMKKTIPKTSSMQTVVGDLLYHFENIVTNPLAWNEVMARHLPPRPISKWSRASLQHGSGYTAGLWILFHIMSVGLVQWNHLAVDDRRKIIPATMADIQRNYIEHFFQCEECRLNFLSDFDACMYDRCNRLATTVEGGTLDQYVQYPLWLYETHNAVNVRLRKERIEQNIENENFTTQAEIVWPTASSCPSCWLSRDKGRWDELEVYKFLQRSYWLDNDNSEVLRILSGSEDAFESTFSIEHGKLRGDNNDELDFSSVGLWCCFAFMGALAWCRKRQYHQKGMHKKIESHLS